MAVEAGPPRASLLSPSPSYPSSSPASHLSQPPLSLRYPGRLPWPPKLLPWPRSPKLPVFGLDEPLRRIPVTRSSPVLCPLPNLACVLPLRDGTNGSSAPGEGASNHGRHRLELQVHQSLRFWPEIEEAEPPRPDLFLPELPTAFLWVFSPWTPASSFPVVSSLIESELCFFLPRSVMVVEFI